MIIQEGYLVVESWTGIWVLASWVRADGTKIASGASGSIVDELVHWRFRTVARGLHRHDHRVETRIAKCADMRNDGGANWILVGRFDRLGWRRSQRLHLHFHMLETLSRAQSRLESYQQTCFHFQDTDFSRKTVDVVSSSHCLIPCSSIYLYP
jgi:hypothetical protein